MIINIVLFASYKIKDMNVQLSARLSPTGTFLKFGFVLVSGSFLEQ